MTTTIIIIVIFDLTNQLVWLWSTVRGSKVASRLTRSGSAGSCSHGGGHWLFDVECILSKQPRKVSSGLVARVVFQQVYTIHTSRGGCHSSQQKVFQVYELLRGSLKLQFPLQIFYRAEIRSGDSLCFDQCILPVYTYQSDLFYYSLYYFHVIL